MRGHLSPGGIHRHHSAVHGAFIHDYLIPRIVAFRGRDLPIEQRRVEFLRLVHLPRHQFVPAQSAGSIHELCSDMLLRLPDSECRSGRILRDCHFPILEYIERFH